MTHDPELLRRNRRARFNLISDPEALSAGITRVMQSPALQLLAECDRANAELLLAEVLNNIGEHAYGGRRGMIRLRLEYEADMLILRFEDGGIAMPGGDLPEGKLPNPLDLPEGGFGWFLIRELASDLQYERDAGRNRLSLRLRLEQSSC